MLLLCLLVLAAVEDVRSGKVSNRLIATGLMTGVFVQIYERRVCGVYYFLGNISIPVILLYLLFQMRVLGAGDIKLFSMIGGILTIQELFAIMAYSFIAAGAGAGLYLVVDQQRRQKLYYAGRYLLDFVRTGKIEPYLPPFASESFSFALSVPVLFGAVYVLYL
ncbi:MAG: prepilin peptidase [Eubacterium sp.]|jgi:prepilin peptidase CpaA|nr:prepilin peptidase [Eubacterium sp.]